MASFDKIESGLPQVDEILNHIRIGDNVVWQVTDVEEFRYFAELFAKQAVKDRLNVIYIRFAQHAPVLKDLTGVTVREFDPDDGFESFTVGIHEEITRQGKEAFYVFDCLSELQSVWYTDLIMGNFFRVTCPYLFLMDTVAFQDMVETQIRYHAVFGDRRTLAYCPELFFGLPDRFSEICSSFPELAGMIQVLETKCMFCCLDALENRCICGILSDDGSLQNLSCGS